jgi:hypothetical protein
MKHLIFLMIAFCSILSMRAQESTTDYIYSGDGFEVKKVVPQSEYINRDGWTIGPSSAYSYGLYSKDGKVLVSAITYWGNYYLVLDGCETICSKAFQTFCGCSICIPSSVKSIAPDALNSGGGFYGRGTTHYMSANKFYDIVDGCIEETSNSSSSSNALKLDSDVTEVARYNIIFKE